MFHLHYFSDFWVGSSAANPCIYDSSFVVMNYGSKAFISGGGQWSSYMWTRFISSFFICFFLVEVDTHVSSWYVYILTHAPFAWQLYVHSLTLFFKFVMSREAIKSNSTTNTSVFEKTTHKN